MVKPRPAVASSSLNVKLIETISLKRRGSLRRLFLCLDEMSKQFFMNEQSNV